MKRTSTPVKPRPWLTLFWVGFVLHTLTYCSGSTHGGGEGGSAGLGFAGHTADCAKNCSLGGCLGSPGCPLPAGGNAGSGGTPSVGSGGVLGGVGGVSAGMGGFGFAGHTANCLNGCQPGCGIPCGGGGGNSGGTPAVVAGMGGALDGGGEAGQAAGGEPAAMRRKPASNSLACYELAGYEADPCLPPDDSLLDWLNAPNLGCALSVVGGPTLATGPTGRTCCYSVSCAQPSE